MNFSRESCHGCAAPQKNTGDATGNQGEQFTYDEGEGVKDQIVIQGPLQEVLRGALDAIFTKDPISVASETTSIDQVMNSGIADNKTPALESQSQDAYITEVIDDIRNTPGAEVVLADFNYKENADHVARAQSGKPLQQNEQDPTLIPVYVALADDLVKPTVMDALDTDKDFYVLVLDGVDTAAGDVDVSEHVASFYKDNKTSQWLGGVDSTDRQVCYGDITGKSALDKVISLERAYEGTRSRLCFGIGQLVTQLQKHRKPAR